MDLAGQVIGADYIQFYAAGLTIFNGQDAKLYDFAYQSQLEQSIAGPGLTSFHAFITPPFFALPFAILSRLSYPLSFIAWSLIGLLGLWLSIRWLGYPRPWSPFFWSLTFFPIFAAISFGQNSLVSLTILCLVYWFWKRDKMLLAGLAGSLVLFKPQLALGILILWLFDWHRSWRAILGIGLGGICLSTLSLIWMPDASLAYLNFMLTELPALNTQAGYPLWHLHTVNGFWLLLFPGQSWLANLTLLLTFLIGGFYFYRLCRQFQAHRAVLYAFAIGLTLLVTPHAMIYDWSLLLIPALLLWAHQPAHRPHWQASFAIIWIISLLSGVLVYLQLKILPIAIQISVPIYLFILADSYLTLINVSKPTLPNYEQGRSR
jgi:hypothetical protein